MSEPETKVCKMCCSEIPKAARKCPHCQQLQHTLAILAYHPFLTSVYCAMIAGVILYTFYLVLVDLPREGESFTPYAGQMEVTESKIVFGEWNSGPTVSVIGRVKNNSPITWEDVTFDLDFFDEEGTLIDSGQENEYSYRLPTGREVSFKITFRRLFPEADYHSHTVRVIWAKDERGG